MRVHVPADLRRLVAEDAGGRCGYCLMPQAYSSLLLETEHIVPLCKGGTTVRDNLWLACATCNRFKGTQTEVIDPTTGQVVRLFSPRADSWRDCFRWSSDGLFIIGQNAIGRVTVEALKLNHERWVECRRIWRLAHMDFPPTLS